MINGGRYSCRINYKWDFFPERKRKKQFIFFWIKSWKENFFSAALKQNLKSYKNLVLSAIWMYWYMKVTFVLHYFLMLLFLNILETLFSRIIKMFIKCFSFNSKDFNKLQYLILHWFWKLRMDTRPFPGFLYYASSKLEGSSFSSYSGKFFKVKRLSNLFLCQRSSSGHFLLLWIDLYGGRELP